jgi:hypothetical protein
VHCKAAAEDVEALPEGDGASPVHLDSRRHENFRFAKLQQLFQNLAIQADSLQAGHPLPARQLQKF